MLQEFDIEIREKKGSDNVIADYLSRIEMSTEEGKGTEIDEKFPNKQLFQMTMQMP